jgi:hypothetical protein
MAPARNTDPDATGRPAPIEVFRAGTHVDASGRRVTITEADLAAIAASYDPGLHEAPIVVGHPADDAPAYGWIERLQADGGTLRAVPRQVEPRFAELVREGRFKKVSIALYGPEAPGNPAKGGWYLRHVGFLGAQPPAVKGLAPVRFAGGDEGVVEFAESWSLSLAARLFRGLRELILTQFGAEAADRALPAAEIDAIAETPAPAAAAFSESPSPQPSPAAAAEDETKKETAMPDPDRSAEFAEREQALAAREAEAAAREQRLAAAERARREAEDAQFVEGLVREARLPVELKPLAASLLSQLDATATVEFAEAGSVTPRDALRALLGRLPQRVSFAEHAGADGVRAADPADRRSIEAAADALVKKRADAGQTITFREAVRLVTGERDA